MDRLESEAVETLIRNWLTSKSEELKEDVKLVLARLNIGYLVTGNSVWDLIAILSGGVQPLTVEDLVTWVDPTDKESVECCMEVLWEAYEEVLNSRNRCIIG